MISSSEQIGRLGMLERIRKIVKELVPSSIGTTIGSSHLGRLVDHVTRPHDRVYSQNYYDAEVEPTAIQSAAIMAKSIVECFQVKTVIDVGCGTGALLEAFRNLNCQVLGLEYSEAGLAYCTRRELPVRKFNIGKDNIDAGQHDVALSFEVAEHLSPWTANRFVDLLCNLSRLVVISAAAPGQGGTDHVNEQPASYWINKFKKRGYVLDQKSADRLSTDWKTAGTTLWYHTNVLVFVRSGES